MIESKIDRRQEGGESEGARVKKREMRCEQKGKAITRQKKPEKASQRKKEQ